MIHFMTLLLLATLFLSHPIQAGDKTVFTQNIQISTKGNEIAFDKTNIQVPFGKKVNLKFSNKSAKGSEIIHDIAILKPGTTDEVLKQLVADGYDQDKIRKHPSILAMSKIIEPGVTADLEFNPPKPGLYPYLCLMAGHADMLGMKGVLDVK